MSWSCRPPKRDDAGHNRRGHGQRRDDVAEIAAEEAVAVFRLDAGGELGPRSGCWRSVSGNWDLPTSMTSFELLRRNADRRLQVWELEAKIADDPVLAGVGEATWRSPRGCEALRETVGLSAGDCDCQSARRVRARFESADGPAFARLLENSVVSIGLAG